MATTVANATSKSVSGRLAHVFTFQRVVGAVLIAYLSWQVVLPMVGLLFSSLKDERPGDEGYFNLNLTFSNYSEVFSSRALRDATMHSVVFMLCSSALALFLGTMLAWITKRTNAICGGLIGAVVLAQLIIPEVLVPISWGLLGDPETGLINYWWRQFTGGDGNLLNVYSLPGMILVQAIVMSPLVYVFAVPALTAIDQSLEEAALVAGAPPRRVMWDIVYRLAYPALAATAILLMVRSWEAFEVPWYLGLRAKILTYSTEIYFRTISPPTDTGIISSFAMPMLLVGIALTVFYGRLNRVSGRYAVVGGKAFRADPLRLSPVARWVVGVVGLLVVLVAIVLPLLALVWMSTQRFFRPPSIEALQFASLGSYRKLFANDDFVMSMVNSCIVAISTGVLVVLVALLSAYMTQRTKYRGRAGIDRLTFFAVAIPNIIVGVSFLWIFRLLPGGLSGSRLGLILAYVTIFIAIASRNITARAMQVSSELDEAAVVSGATPVVVMRTVVAPLLTPALVGSLLYVVAAAFRELPTALLLTDPDSQTVTALLAFEASFGTVSGLAAIGVVMVVFMMVLIGLFQAIARRFGIQRVF